MTERSHDEQPRACFRGAPQQDIRRIPCRCDRLDVRLDLMKSEERTGPFGNRQGGGLLAPD